MDAPGVPGTTDGGFTLPCGRTIRVDALDMGMRELECTCGDRHAVVMDVHPLGRWIPESVVDILTETVEPSDDHDAFGTIHLMGMVLEEYPDRVAVHDATDTPTVGWAMAWVAEQDARTLHELVVELLVELMDHAVGHATDESVRSEFGRQLAEFDIDAFVTAYRDVRDFDDERDQPA